MEKKISVSKIPGSLNLKFTFQFDHSSIFSNPQIVVLTFDIFLSVIVAPCDTSILLIQQTYYSV